MNGSSPIFVLYIIIYLPCCSGSQYKCIIIAKHKHQFPKFSLLIFLELRQSMLYGTTSPRVGTPGARWTLIALSQTQKSPGTPFTLLTTLSSCPIAPFPPWIVWHPTFRPRCALFWRPTRLPGRQSTPRTSESRSPPLSPYTWGTSTSRAGERQRSFSMFLSHPKCARVDRSRHGMRFRGSRKWSCRIKLAE